MGGGEISPFPISSSKQRTATLDVSLRLFILCCRPLALLTHWHGTTAARQMGCPRQAVTEKQVATYVSIQLKLLLLYSIHAINVRIQMIEMQESLHKKAMTEKSPRPGHTARDFGWTCCENCPETRDGTEHLSSPRRQRSPPRSPRRGRPPIPRGSPMSSWGISPPPPHPLQRHFRESFMPKPSTQVDGQTAGLEMGCCSCVCVPCPASRQEGFL